MHLPDTNQGIKEVKERLEAVLHDTQRELTALQAWCRHEGIETRDYLGRKEWKKCEFCGFYDEWWK